MVILDVVFTAEEAKASEYRWIRHLSEVVGSPLLNRCGNYRFDRSRVFGGFLARHTTK